MTYTTEELQAMLDSATPGPWGLIERTNHFSPGVRAANGEYVVPTTTDPNEGIARTSNARLIAAAWTAVREVIALREQVSRLKLDLIAALGEGIEAAPVKVKPLVWEDHSGACYSWPIGLHYYSEKDAGEWLMSLMVGGEDIETWGPFWTMRDAKAAAQADYEARILAALEAAPGE